MQSFSSKVFCACLRAVFHSPLIDSAKYSDFAGQKTKNRKSHYKPSKEFIHSRHACGKAYYEKIVYKNSNTDKVIYLIHGGSFKVKLIDMYRKLAEKYSRLFDGATVVSVDYRIFPQHPHPAQLEDTVNVYIELLNQGIKSENIVFFGDSAGANLALTASLWLRDNNMPLPSAIVCFSLWGDATSSGESRIRNAYKDPFGGISKRKRIEDNLPYLRRVSKYAEKLDRENPYVSPCFGSFEGFPPVTLVCGTAEMDESDNDTAYERMKAAGVDTVLYKFEGMFHVFQLVPFLKESKEAYKMVKNRINGGKGNGNGNTQHEQS